MPFKLPMLKAAVMDLAMDQLEVFNLDQDMLQSHLHLPPHNWFAINKVSVTLLCFGMKLMSTFLHFLQFLHFEEILKTHALLTSLVKISPPTLTISLKICDQLIVSKIYQTFKFM
jgi:hypothetical protein